MMLRFSGWKSTDFLNIAKLSLFLECHFAVICPEMTFFLGKNQKKLNTPLGIGYCRVGCL
jgi:hypothetical protein